MAVKSLWRSCVTPTSWSRFLVHLTVAQIIKKSFKEVKSPFTFIGPCIVMYSYSTTNKMHLFLKLSILVKRSTCFERSFRPSSGAQNCTYGNRHMSNSFWYLLLAELAAGTSSCLTYACCRMCSFELLMMDGKTVRNM